MIRRVNAEAMSAQGLLLSFVDRFSYLECAGPRPGKKNSKMDSSVLCQYAMSSRDTRYGALHRYSAKRMVKPVNFFFHAPHARAVVLVGDFNDWNPETHCMQRHPDGSWSTQVQLHHGHHLYRFLVDGEPVLDPRAHGVVRHDRNGRVSVVAVS